MHLPLRTNIWRIGGIWLAVIVLYIVSGLLSRATLNVQHLLEVLQVTSFLGVVAVGQTFVILTGGIDLSVAGVITLANLVSAGVMDGRNAMVVPGLLLVLALGSLVGLINGLLVTRVRITPLIVTLAMNSILYGASLIYTHGAPHGAIPQPLTVLGQGHILQFPVSALVWIIITFLAAVLARRTVYGRQLYAVGANPRAARLLGIPVERTLIVAYMLSGLTAAMAGLILTAYIGLPSLGIGDPYLLNSIAAVVIGGTALTGGVGSVINSAGGALFMTQLTSLTNMLQLSTGSQFVVQGLVIAAGMSLNTLHDRVQPAISRVGILKARYRGR